MNHHEASIYSPLVRAYKAGKIKLTKNQKVILKAILKGREGRVMSSRLELGEALYCTLVVADKNLKTELEWWKASKG